MSPASTQMYQLLRHYGHLQYHIEYHRFLSNHVAHGIVALNRLGADSATMDTWAMAYGRKLEPPVQDDTHITPDTFPAFIGANRSYLPLVRFLESELANQKAAGGDWRSLLRNYVPRLADGVSGAAFHGLLHLGYGVAVAEEDDGSIDLVIEGLAYAAFSHHPLGPLTSPIGQPANQNKRSLLEVLEAVRHDVRFSSALAHTNDSSNRSLHYFSSNGFQVKMHILGQYAFDALQEHIEALRIYHTPTPTGSDARDWLNSQGRDLLLGLLHVFIHCTIPNDFFILHTITACWALRKILPYLAEDDQHEALIHFTKSALAGYIARSAPEIHEKIPPNKNSDAKPWTELRDACFADPEKDEHTIKLVMVCFELAQELRLEGEYIGNLNAVKDVGLADAGSGVRGGWSGREVERELRIAGTQSLGGFLL